MNAATRPHPLPRGVLDAERPPTTTVATVSDRHGWIGADVDGLPDQLLPELRAILSDPRARHAFAAAPLLGAVRLACVTPATPAYGRKLAGLIVDHHGRLTVAAADVRRDGTVRYRAERTVAGHRKDTPPAPLEAGQQEPRRQSATGQPLGWCPADIDGQLIPAGAVCTACAELDDTRGHPVTDELADAVAMCCAICSRWLIPAPRPATFRYLEELCTETAP